MVNWSFPFRRSMVNAVAVAANSGAADQVAPPIALKSCSAIACSRPRCQRSVRRWCGTHCAAKSFGSSCPCLRGSGDRWPPSVAKNGSNGSSSGGSKIFGLARRPPRDAATRRGPRTCHKTGRPRSERSRDNEAMPMLKVEFDDEVFAFMQKHSEPLVHSFGAGGSADSGLRRWSVRDRRRLQPEALEAIKRLPVHRRRWLKFWVSCDSCSAGAIHGARQLNRSQRSVAWPPDRSRQIRSPIGVDGCSVRSAPFT